MTAEAADRPPARPAPATRSNRPFWIAIGVLALLLIAMYGWKVASVNRAEDRNTKSMLVLAAVPLGLSAREEAMARNYGLMQERFERLLREPGVERVLFAAANDSIAVSTDRSLLGKPLTSAIPEEHTRPSGTEVVSENGTYQAIVPITGLNERLGLVVLTYREPRAVEAEPASPGQ
jgi:hypothetical protein